MRHVLADLLAAAGRRLEDYLTLVAWSTRSRGTFTRMGRCSTPRDWPRLAEQIAAIDARDVEGYAAHLAYAGNCTAITGPLFIYGERPGLYCACARPRRRRACMAPWLRMDASIRRYVRSPHLVPPSSAALRPTSAAARTLAGHARRHQPRRADASASGTRRAASTRMACALARLAGELGVEVRTGSRVAQVEVRDGRAVGVTLASGQFLPADAVLANGGCDDALCVAALRGVISARKVDRLTSARHSCSGFILPGIRGEHPQLAHHNIFFWPRLPAGVRGYLRPRRAACGADALSRDMSKTERNDAPVSTKNWYVLGNAPPTGPARLGYAGSRCTAKSCCAALRSSGWTCATAS